MKKAVVYLLCFLLVIGTVSAATVSHNASQINAGTFGAGDFQFQNYVGIATNPDSNYGQLRVYSTLANPGANDHAALSLSGSYGGGISMNDGATATMWLVNGGSDWNFGMGPSGGARTTIMTIQNDSKVGIGTDAPGEKLTVVSPTGAIAYFGGNNANNWISLSDDNGLHTANYGVIGGGNPYIYTMGNFSVYTGGTEYMRVTSAGNVGIGTTTPSSKLQVSGGPITSDGIVLTTTGPAYQAGVLGYTDGNWGMLFRPPRAGGIGAFDFRDFAGNDLMYITESGVMALEHGYFYASADDSHAALILNQGTPASYNLDINFNDATNTRWTQSVRLTDSSDDFWFYNAGRATADLILKNSNGHIGIGTAPSYKLHISDSTAGGRAVYGYQSGTGATFGGFFQSTSTTNGAMGVYGYASGASGATYGVYGQVASTNTGAYPGYFVGGSGVYTSCPTGFVFVGNGRQIGCIQSIQNEQTDWYSANRNCYTNFYGSRLPSSSEIYLAYYYYVLNAETEVWVDDYCHAGSNGAHGTSNAACSTGNYPYHCWLEV